MAMNLCVQINVPLGRIYFYGLFYDSEFSSARLLLFPVSCFAPFFFFYNATKTLCSFVQRAVFNVQNVAACTFFPPVLFHFLLVI